MKKYTLFLLAVIALASCSTPKYTYYFDHHDYNSGKKKSLPAGEVVAASEPSQEPVLTMDENTLTASTKENEPAVTPAPTMTKEEAMAKIKSMSKEERKELKKEIKKYIKENKSQVSAGSASGSRGMEGDVKLAIIFGAAGLVLLIIGGDVLYILGAIALVIGLFFLIRWLTRQ